MDVQKAKDFIRQNARPPELAEFRCHLENGPAQALAEALKPYQNPDGGFGHALEPDNWNPHSSPISTNDAIGRLFAAGALDKAGDMCQAMVRYLTSGQGFDAEKQRWLFAIDTNKDAPHAVWWEKQGDGISGWNPTVSLAAFLVCMGAPGPWRGLVSEAFRDLGQPGEKSGDGAKCYMLAWNLLKHYGIGDVVDLGRAQGLIRELLAGTVCQDTAKYGVEYAPTPSWFFFEDSPFRFPGAEPLIQAELDLLGRQQLEDGGFDITWQWYTPFEEAFKQARDWWRPRVTLEKLRFFLQHQG